MHKDVIANADMAIFAEIGLIIFLAAFLLIIARAIFMRKDRAQHLANLPLEDGQPPLGFDREREQEST